MSSRESWEDPGGAEAAMDALIVRVVNNTTRAILVCGILTGCFYLLYGGVMRTAVLFAVSLTCMLYGMGVRWLQRLALLALFVTALVAFEAIPHPNNWKKATVDLIRDISQAIR